MGTQNFGGYSIIPLQLFVAEHKNEWIFTKLDLCIEIAEILIGIANGQILSIFDSFLPATQLHFCFQKII